MREGKVVAYVVSKELAEFFAKAGNDRRADEEAPFGWLWIEGEGRESRPATREELIASDESEHRTSRGYGLFRLPDGRAAFVIGGDE